MPIHSALPSLFCARLLVAARREPARRHHHAQTAAQLLIETDHLRPGDVVVQRVAPRPEDGEQIREEQEIDERVDKRRGKAHHIDWTEPLEDVFPDRQDGAVAPALDLKAQELLPDGLAVFQKVEVNHL